MKILKTIRKFTENHFIIVGLALVLGVLYGNYLAQYAYLSTTLLAAIFFLSSLKIDLKKVRQYLGDKLVLAIVNIFMLFILPVAVYYVTNAIYPTLAIAFLLLAAMPAGMTAPLLAEISGGKQSLALVLTVTTSLLAPITAPFIIKTVAGAQVDVSFWAMFTTLAIVIYIPFIFAQIIKRFWQRAIDKVAISFKPISVILLGLLIMVVIAKQSDAIMAGFKNGDESIIYLAALFIFFLILHLLGHFAIFWKKRDERITITVCLTYMNFTLAIELANKFFTEPNIVIPVVFSVIPWAIMLIPYKRIMQKKTS
ncbi:bile acid:sodium symporter family protein [Patescibacteria group bacterium]